MKHYPFYFGLLLCIGLMSFSSNARSESGNKTIRFSEPISDLVLIYHGGTQRPDWNKEQLQPYVYRNNLSKPEWLFDGFLFLEIFDSVRNYEFDHGFGYRSAGKEQWQWLLDRNFATQKGPDALESILSDLARKGQQPLRKRKVVISIPAPFYGYKEWGSVNNKKLDFNQQQDRILAAKWYIDQALKKWKAKNYKNIQLSGFYWVSEEAQNSDDVLVAVKKYLKSKQLRFYWIPYWKAAGSDQWQKYGFDIAYQQPNHFFETTIPDARLDSACIFARQHKLGLEMEFDERVDQPDFGRRFYAYIDAFKKYHVWDSCPVAYYEGGGAFLKIANSKDPVLKKMYTTLTDILVKHQQQADAHYKMKKPVRR